MSDLHFRIAVVAGAVIFGLLVARLRFCGELELPAKPRKPSVAAQNAKEVAKRLNESQEAYMNQIKVDAAQLGVRRPGLPVLRAPLKRQVSEKEFVMQVGDRVETAGLALALSAEAVEGSRHKHMILTIENLGNRAVAYRIDEMPSSGERSCGKMIDLPHNATAIAARSTEKRSVCAYRKGWSLKVKEVETLELWDLGFHYVGGVPIKALSVNQRGLSKHRGSKEAVECDVVMPAVLRRKIESRQISWRNQIDFYARHPCQSYDFPTDYKAFVQDDPRSLPVSTR